MKLSVKSRIYLLSGIPLLVILYFVINGIYTDYKNLKQIESDKPLIDLAEVNASFIHHLQMERGLTVIHINSSDDKSWEKFSTQQNRLDEQLVNLQNKLNAFNYSDYSAGLEQSASFLSSLSTDLLKLRTTVR